MMNLKLFAVFFAVLWLGTVPLAHATTFEKKVTAGADDAYEVDGSMVVGGPIVVAGKAWGSTFRGGYRFTDVSIPKGAKIESASLLLAYNWESGANPKTILYGQAVDNAFAFSASGYDITNRPRTVAAARWTVTSSGPWGAYTSSPDLSSIVQEVVSRPGWASGNSMAILFFEDPQTANEWESVSYEGGASYAAVLRVSYTAGASDDPDTTKPPAQKVIIFRDDDAQIWWRVDTFKNITNTLINNGVPQTIGVIPNVGGYPINDDPNFQAYLNLIKNYNTVELALHGYKHSYYEFGSLSIRQATQKINSGMSIFKSDLGIVPTTFIPPNQAFNSATLTALKNKGFTRFSADLNNDPYAWEENPSGLLHLPQTADFYDWDTDTYNTADQIAEDCQSSIDASNVCVITLHYFQFTDSDYVVVNPDAYQTLLDVIKWAKMKEAEGVKLITMKQYSK